MAYREELFREPVTFDGKTFDKKLDAKRLLNQLERVAAALWDGGWYTIPEIKELISRPPYDTASNSESGISARLRDLRKSKFGSLQVESRRRDHRKGGGLWEYRIVHKETSDVL